MNAAVAEGITSLATVHDSFGCLPSRAERFRKIIREQFVQMYEENDVPAQVLEQARKDWVRTRKVYLRSRRSMAIWILSRCSEQNTRSPEWRCYSA